MRVSGAICTSVGKKRKLNQDNFAFRNSVNNQLRKDVIKCHFPSAKENVYGIFDGMGGEENGEIASRIAAQTLLKYRKKYSQLTDRFEEHMLSYLRTTNNILCKLMQDEKLPQMGCTAVVLCVSPRKKTAIACNIGDSKAFLLRDGDLKMITEDHNQAQSLFRLGVIDEAEAREHKGKSVLTQHLGIAPDELMIEPYTSDVVMLKKNDRFLLCSDGLTDALTNEEITGILQKKKCVRAAARALIKEANAHNSKDNVTALVVRV